MDEDEQIAAEIDNLILEGAMLPDHLDEDGDMVFTFDMNKLKEVNPDLYKEQMDEIEKSIESLVDLGLVEGAGVDEEGNIVYTITEEGAAAFEQYLDEI